MSHIWLKEAVPDHKPIDHVPEPVHYAAEATVFTQHARWREMPLTELLAAQATLTPLTPAVIFQDQMLSYADLDTSANQLGHHLQRCGVGPEQVVAIFWEHGTTMLEALVAILGIWKAGGAYLFITSDEGLQRQQFILQQARPQVILTVERLRSRLPATGSAAATRILCLDDSATCADIAKEPLTAPRHAVKPEALAFIIYTSGTSSGVPKGVLVTHAHLGELAASLIALFGVKPGDHLSQLLPLGFDASLSEILPALLSGATLHPLPAAVGSAGLIPFLQAQAITLAQIPPSLLPMLLDADLPALRTIATGGDRAAPEIVECLDDQGKRVINCYGLTETIVCSVADQITGQEPFAYPLSYLGKPLPYARVLIVDDAGQPLPAGTQGEIALFPTARGYVDQSLDAERFLLHEGWRYCRTGDIGFIDPGTGALIFWGRKDTDIVKLRGGELVSLPAIEAAVLAFRAPLVKECLVLVCRDVTDIDQLVAYVVMSDEQALDRVALRQHLARHLLPYQVPLACVVVPALARTAIGKAPRDAALYPSLTEADLLSFTPELLPQTPVERQLAALVIEVANLPATPETLDCRLTLRQVGFPSARAAKLLKRIAATFPVHDLPPEIASGAIQDIAAAIEEQVNGA